MQTFLPYENFDETAKCLDMKRLGKQRVEVLQILTANLQGPNYSRWYNHPACKMWRGHEIILCEYGLAICAEWRKRGYKDTCYGKLLRIYGTVEECDTPWWLGFKEFHDSHKSNLLRKFPEHYKDFGWDVSDDLPYFWPSKRELRVC